MALLLHGDVVLANGYRDFVLTIGIRRDGLALLGADLPIHVELHALHGIVGACVADGAAHGERRDVGEVRAVVYQRVVAHEAQLLRRIELVDAQGGDDGVGRTLARERHTLDDVVAVAVGLGLQLQLCRCQVRRLGIAANKTVVLVIDGTVARIVEELCVQALVEGPVRLQLLLVAHQQVVVVLQDFGLGERLRPETELIHIAHEVT